MRLYLYVDESGKFEPGVPPGVSPPVVMGVVTGRSPSDLETLFRRAIAAFNRANRSDFRYPDDMHCKELFESGRALAAPFATAMLDATLASDPDPQLVVSENPRERVDWDIQAAYIANLTALVWTMLERIASGALHVDSQGISSLSIVIATREGFEDRVVREYIHRGKKQLREYLLYACGRAAEVEGRQDVIPLLGKLSPSQITYEVAKGHAGLMAADFCAFYWRCRKHELPRGLAARAWVTSPGERIPTNVVELVTRLSADDAVGAADWSALYEFGLRFGGRAGWDRRNAEFLEKLREADERTLGRQLPGFWHLAERLIDRRTENDAYLPAARDIYAAIRDATGACLAENPSSKTVALYLVDSLDGLIRCANHTGDTKAQGELASSYAQAMDDHAALLGGYSAVERRKLELLNRFANVPMNDYRFDEVLRVMTPAMEDLKARVPSGQTDELLGKLLGTIGQAFAFKARIERELAAKAMELLTESLAHFAPGTGYRSMTLNFLTTLAWQSGDLDAACRWFSQQPGLDSVVKPEDLWDKVQPLVEAKRFFELANALRILAAFVRNQPRGRRRALVQSRPLDVVSQCELRSEHPVHQVYKWTAVLYLMANQTKRAEEVAAIGIREASRREFTIQTIGLSICPISYRAASTATEREALLDRMGNALRALARYSGGFAEYLGHFGGPEGLTRKVESDNEDDLWEALTFPPFAYA